MRAPASATAVVPSEGRTGSWRPRRRARARRSPRRRTSNRCPRPRRHRRARARRARPRPRPRKAVPIRLPRRPGGDAATSHASAPVQENALASPWRNRARSSCHASFAIPNSTVQKATAVSPITTVGLTPARAATIPLGMAPTSAPAGYAAASTPAPALPRPSVAAYCGSSGVSAAKKSVSKKTIALARSKSLRTPLLCRSAMRVLPVLLAALAVPGLAHGGTVFLLDGRGWGHGVGMSQWGAEGYARHGSGYRQILAHYYPHTHIGLAGPANRARVAPAGAAVAADRLGGAVPRRRCARQQGASAGRAPWSSRCVQGAVSFRCGSSRARSRCASAVRGTGAISSSGGSPAD